MDVMAIVDHGRPTDPTPAEPSIDDLLAAFTASGKSQITAAKLAEGKQALQTERAVEAIWAPAYHDDIKAHMPWTSAIFTVAPGGVSFGAEAIAGYYFHLWRQLLDKPVTTKVVATYPANRTEGVPSTGWVRSYQAGSNATGGGARTADHGRVELLAALRRRREQRPHTRAAAGGRHGAPRSAHRCRGADHGRLSPDRPLQPRHRRAPRRSPARRRPPAVSVVPGRGHRPADRRRRPTGSAALVALPDGEGRRPRLPLTCCPPPRPPVPSRMGTRGRRVDETLVC